MQLKSAVKNYLNLTKSEWNGLVILLLLTAIVLAAPWVYERWHQPTKPDFTRFEKAVKILHQAGVTAGNDDTAADIKPVLFKFNPNHLPEKQWLKLGLQPRQVRGIKNYEAHGGHFYTVADVKKMYTLTEADFKRLQPYIDLPQAGAAAAERRLKVVELNTADSATLESLKGVGPALARRIIQYRLRLGGYHQKQQLKEIYGLDAMHYQDIQAQFWVNPRKIKKLKLNKVELEDLKNFPYLSYKQANAIVQYRHQHGDYETFDELQQIVILDDKVLQKIKPYFTLN